MKKSFYVLIAAAILTGGCVMAEDIAVVDLQTIVSNSSQVKQLKVEHKKKLEELDKILVNARGEIANETDANKIAKLEEKYTKEFNAKRNAIESEYNEKLGTIEKNIKDEIAKKAQKEDYDYVFAKSVVLYGGKDITNEINVK
ncbi:OmpH family outer membrane protein [bacterium]|nr:OmpH family outer membrane protein [bacterium]